MITKSMPNPEAAQESWTEAATKRSFWETHYLELLERYPDQFVAVQKGEVIANAPDLTQLVVLLGAKGVDITKVWVRYVSDKSHRFLL